MDSQYGAIVLCGGASSRIGRDKATLPFGPTATLLERVVGVLQAVVPSEAINVVAARDQRLPTLPNSVRVVHESADGQGPLFALSAGLAQMPSQITVAFACGCDAPLLKPAFVARMLELVVDGIDAAVPVDDERLYPLAAAYRATIAMVFGSAIAAGERSLHRALRRGLLQVREVDVEQLCSVDPQLDSLVNCNSQEEYELALRRAGLSPYH